MVARTGDPRFYTDMEAEERFGVSASKLRTAQRYGLVESYQSLQKGRYVRVWDENSAGKAYVASLMSEHLSVSFQVACCLLVSYNQGLPDEAETARRVRTREIGSQANDLRYIYEADRTYFYTSVDDTIDILGLMGHDDANRMTLVPPCKRTKLPEQDTFLSVIRFDVLRATLMFLAAADA